MPYTPGPPIVVQGITLPARADAEFITPDFQQLFEFYPRFRALAGAGAWDFQPYVIAICEALEKNGARPGRTADQWLRRIIEHFGMSWFAEWCQRYRQP